MMIVFGVSSFISLGDSIEFSQQQGYIMLMQSSLSRLALINWLAYFVTIIILYCPLFPPNCMYMVTPSHRFQDQ